MEEEVKKYLEETTGRPYVLETEDKVPGKILDSDTMKEVFDDMMKTREEYEEKYGSMFRWRTGERFFVTVMKDLEPKDFEESTAGYYGPRIFNYVLRFNDTNWCIHKGQLVLTDEGYVGKIISINIR